MDDFFLSKLGITNERQIKLQSEREKEEIQPNAKKNETHIKKTLIVVEEGIEKEHA